jgi:hypothetical protein
MKAKFTLAMLLLPFLIASCVQKPLTDGTWIITAYPATDDREVSFTFNRFAFRGDENAGDVDPDNVGSSQGRYL